MKTRVISYNLAKVQALEDNLNEWLSEVGDIHIIRMIPLGNAGSEGDSGAIIILYQDSGDTPNVDKLMEEHPTSEFLLCGQCKKNPALEGMKVCDECREYQRQYRKKQKDEKKKSRYP